MGRRPSLCSRPAHRLASTLPNHSKPAVKLQVADLQAKCLNTVLDGMNRAGRRQDRIQSNWKRRVEAARSHHNRCDCTPVLFKTFLGAGGLACPRGFGGNCPRRLGLYCLRLCGCPTHAQPCNNPTGLDLSSTWCVCGRAAQTGHLGDEESVSCLRPRHGVFVHRNGLSGTSWIWLIWRCPTLHASADVSR